MKTPYAKLLILLLLPFLLGGSSLRTSYTDFCSDGNIVACYTFNEDVDKAIDISGRDGHGTVTGATLTTDGADKYYAFDSNDLIALPKTKLIDGLGAYPRTMYALMSDDDSSSPDMIAFSLADTASNSNYWAIGTKAENYFVYYFRSGGVEWITYTTVPPVIGTKYCIVGVSSASNNHILYIDGVSRGTSSTDSTPDSVDTATIGGLVDDSPSYGSGKVYEAAIWDRALSPAEVKEICTYGLR